MISRVCALQTMHETSERKVKFGGLSKNSLKMPSRASLGPEALLNGDHADGVGGRQPSVIRAGHHDNVVTGLHRAVGPEVLDALVDQFIDVGRG